jgi:hypothetical protein
MGGEEENHSSSSFTLGFRPLPPFLLVDPASSNLPCFADVASNTFKDIQIWEISLSSLWCLTPTAIFIGCNALTPPRRSPHCSTIGGDLIVMPFARLLPPLTLVTHLLFGVPVAYTNYSMSTHTSTSAPLPPIVPLNSSVMEPSPNNLEPEPNP